jgi:hypothetical protein
MAFERCEEAAQLIGWLEFCGTLTWSVCDARSPGQD